MANGRHDGRTSADRRGLFETSGEFLTAAGRSALSIRYSLPLVFIFILLAVVLVYSWATYRELSHSASDAAIDRLRRTTEQLALSSEASARRWRASLREAAADSSLQAFFRNPSRSARDAALQRVSAIRAARVATAQRVRVELRGRDERILLAEGPELPAPKRGDSPGIPLRIVRDTADQGPVSPRETRCTRPSSPPSSMAG